MLLRTGWSDALARPQALPRRRHSGRRVEAPLPVLRRRRGAAGSIEERRRRLRSGVDTASIDHGAVEGLPGPPDRRRARTSPGFENLTNLDRLPADGRLGRRAADEDRRRVGRAAAGGRVRAAALRLSERSRSIYDSGWSASGSSRPDGRSIGSVARSPSFSITIVEARGARSRRSGRRCGRGPRPRAGRARRRGRGARLRRLDRDDEVEVGRVAGLDEQRRLEDDDAVGRRRRRSRSARAPAGGCAASSARRAAGSAKTRRASAGLVDAPSAVEQLGSEQLGDRRRSGAARVGRARPPAGRRRRP